MGIVEYRHEKWRQYKAQGHTNKEVAEHFCVSIKAAQKACAGIAPQKPIPANKLKSEKEIRVYVESLLPFGFSYESGYKNCDSHVMLRCNVCGSAFDASMVSIRKGHKVCCPICEAKGKEERNAIIKRQKLKEAEAKVEAKHRKRLEQAIQSEARKHPCVICGKLTVYKYCCCGKCSRKRNNNIKEVRRRAKLRNAIVDKDITLESVYRRDRGVCYICGGLCNWNDREVRDECVVCGNSYPSLDHVIPLAKGGLHEWGNVRLAHRVCNSLKADNDIPLVKISL